LSQLGYMIMAVGLASGQAAMFHLFTHAFFKALLFLGAGSIIVMLHHEQNIWKMGGLAGRLGITFLTFMVGTLALIGFPPFSGFFSKDAILALAYEKDRAIFWLALFTAFLTAFYMVRLIVVVFFGRPRSDQARAGREAPWVMIGPLILLAIPAFASGFGVVAKFFFVQLPAEKETGWLVLGMAFGATLAGIAVAIVLYRNRQDDPIDFGLLRKRFYFDELYAFLIAATQGLMASLTAFIDRWILDAGFIRGASTTTWGIGSLLRLLQVGNLQAYSFLFGLGIVGLIYFTLFR
ncbi:MAG: NADH-quinone oxidoreductase subunit, partial [Verrucomicrobiota bacterium]